MKTIPETKDSNSNFETLGLTKTLTDTIQKLNIQTPTPIQHQAIPVILKGSDLIGIAQTGTGKTLAFAAPIIQRVLDNNQGVLILVPTRELALQVDETFKSLYQQLPQAQLKSAVLIGGADMSLQMKRLKMNPQIVIATPGRLKDHLNRKSYSLNKVSCVVLDEADRMFDMGFGPEVKKFLEAIPSGRQTLLFSATMSKAVRLIAERFLKSPTQIEIAATRSNAANISQEVMYLAGDKKFPYIKQVLSLVNGKVIVFTKTKRGADTLSEKLYKNGFASTEIHSDRSQSQRKRAIDSFKTGRHQILVATDVAARGIDIDNVELVVNYDLPMNLEDYTHRIGRTGRAGKTGKAISLALPHEARSIGAIQRMTGAKIIVSRAIHNV